MNEAKKMIGKALTTTVVATTIAWSIGLSALVAPLSAAAAASGTLVKASLPAVYYVGGDMKRYVFPNEKTYKTWYSDFSQVQTITDAELASMPIGGNVTYKPGIKMVKITTDPKVYAVDARGTLRWVSSEAVAIALYGANWNQKIDDVQDAFFVNYTIGSDITAAGQFVPATVVATATSINADKGFGTGAAVTGQLQAMLSSGQPVGGSVPRNATGVNMVKADLKNTGSSAITVDSVTVRRTGLGVAADFAAVYVYEGNNRLTTGRTINGTSNEVTFSGLNLSLAAGETKMLWVAADIAAGAVVGNVNSLQIASVNAGTVAAAGLPLSGPSFTNVVAAVGGVTVDKNALTTKPKAGEMGAKLVEFKLTAAVEDILVNKVVLYYAGSVSRSNVTNLVLKQGGLSIASVAGLNAKDQAVFVLSNPFTIEKGNSRIFEMYADIAGSARSTENVSFYVDQASDIAAIGKTYGYGVAVTNNFGSAAAQTLAVEAGQLNVSFNGPASKDIAVNAKDVELFSYTLSAAANLEVKKTTLNVAFTGPAAAGDLEDFKIIDVATGAIVAGPITAAAGANAFTEVYNLAAGQARTFKVTADILNRAAAATGKVKVTLNAFAAGADIRNLDNSTYLVAADIVPSTAIAGNEHTIQASSLTVSVGSTPVSQSYIQGSQGIALLSFGVKAGDASDIKVSSIKLTGYVDNNVTGFVKGTDGTSILSDMMLTAGLWNGTTQVGATKSPGAGADGTMTFDGLNLTVPKGQTVSLVLKGTLSSSIASVVANADRVKFDIAANADIVATDPEGNALTAGVSLTGAPVNGLAVDNGIRMTIKDKGSMSVVLAPSDAETEANTVMGGASNVVLAKYKFTATDEELKLTKVAFQVTAAAAVNSIALYDGATLLGSPAGVNGAGVAVFTGLNLIVAKDSSKVLTVKGNLNAIGAAGATSGSLATVKLLDDDVLAGTYEVRGTSAGSSTVLTLDTNGADNSIAGYAKIVRKSKPTVSLVSLPTTVLNIGDVTIMRFSVAADAAGDVALGEVTVNVSESVLAGLMTFAAAGAKIRRVGSTDVAATATWSGAAGASDLRFALTNEEVVAAGTSRSYDVILNLAGAAVASGDSIASKLVEAAVGTATTAAAARIAADDFVWSDLSEVVRNSVMGANTNTDWTNGFTVKTLPSDSQVLSK